jgi:hypothetical protein
MMKILYVLSLLLFASDAFAASCSAGWLSYDRSLQLQLGASCPSGTTQVGTVPGVCNNSDCFPDYVCASGISKFRTNTGVSVPLYAQRVTKPSLNVSVNNTVCYTPLEAGKSTGTINLNYNNKEYRATALKQCRRNMDATVVPTAQTPGDSSVNWSVGIGNRTLKGISYCGSQGTLAISALNVTSSSVANTTASSNLSANIRCWCRVFSPFPSDWIYVNWFGTGTDIGCNRSCAQACVNAFSQVQTVRANTYNTMY